MANDIATAWEQIMASRGRFPKSASTEFLDSNGLAYNVPSGLRGAMAEYAAKPDSLAARNAAFQEFYKAAEKPASHVAGTKEAEGYNGLANAINQAYGITPEWMEAANAWAKMSEDERNAYLGQQENEEQANLPGLRQGLLTPKPQTQSSLAVLWR